MKRESLKGKLDEIVPGTFLIWKPAKSMYMPSIEHVLDYMGEDNPLMSPSRNEVYVMTVDYPVLRGEGALFTPYVPVKLQYDMEFRDHVTLDGSVVIHAKDWELYKM